jgi:hypothetical protein
VQLFTVRPIQAVETYLARQGTLKHLQYQISSRSTHLSHDKTHRSIVTGAIEPVCPSVCATLTEYLPLYSAVPLAFAPCYVYTSRNSTRSHQHNCVVIACFIFTLLHVSTLLLGHPQMVQKLKHQLMICHAIYLNKNGSLAQNYLSQIVTFKI